MKNSEAKEKLAMILRYTEIKVNDFLTWKEMLDREGKRYAQSASYDFMLMEAKTCINILKLIGVEINEKYQQIADTLTESI